MWKGRSPHQQLCSVTAAASPGPADPQDFLTLFESSPGGRPQRVVLSPAPGEKGATWNVLDEQPKACAVLASTQSPSAPDAPARLRKGECALAPRFTANNRSNKGAVGNCVTSMVHNRHAPSGTAPLAKSSNQTVPSLNNLIKAATSESGEGSGCGKNFSSSGRVARDAAGRSGPSPLPRKEVTEEEAERFIHQVNQAAVTIQRWYRRQVRLRRDGAARLEHLLASKREEQRQRLGGGNLLDLHRREEAARKKAREEKARQARRAAIQELQQKRAQKLGEAEQGLPKEGPPPPPRPALLPSSPAPKANNAGEWLSVTGEPVVGKAVQPRCHALGPKVCRSRSPRLPPPGWTEGAQSPCCVGSCLLGSPVLSSVPGLLHHLDYG
ncbi:centrosomal protein of 131 kDa-like [Ctenodactylus gundi]